MGTGTFTLVLDPQQATAGGSITVTLYDVPQDPIYNATIDGPAVAVATTTPGQNADVFFNGTAGQRVSFRRSNTTYGALSLYIYGPDGSALTGNETADFIEPVPLTLSGEQRLWVNPLGAGTGGFNGNFYDVQPDVTGTLQINGAAIPVTLIDPGQNGSFTFTTTAPNQQATVRVTGNTFNSSQNGCLWLRLYKPGNVQQAFTLSCAVNFNLTQQTLATVGTYTVVTDPRLWNTGNLNLAVTTP